MNENVRGLVDSRETFADRLAAEIRRVDGDHSLGAGALADALMPFLESALAQQPAGEAWTEAQLSDAWIASMAEEGAELVEALRKALAWAWRYEELCDEPEGTCAKDIAEAAEVYRRATGETP